MGLRAGMDGGKSDPIGIRSPDRLWAWVSNCIILISYYWLVKVFLYLAVHLILVKFCASFRGCTLEAFECFRQQVAMFI